MYSRRRGRSSSSKQPAQPTSTAALIAASAVYRPNISSPGPHLAAAAAGAALRHATVTPIPPGTIQTKRMLQRRDNYSFVAPLSDSENGPGQVQRSYSTSSLTERRFRKPKPSPPLSPPVPLSYQRSGTTGTHTRNEGDTRGHLFPSSDDDSEGDSHIRRSVSVRSTSSNASFPNTLRGPTAPDGRRPKPKHDLPTRGMLSRGSLRGAKPAPPSYPDRFRRRSSDPDSTGYTNRGKNQLANRNVHQGEYPESISSTTGSEPGSIAEEEGGSTGRTVRNKLPSRIMEEDSGEDQGGTFDFRRPHKVGATRGPFRKINEANYVLSTTNRTTSNSSRRTRSSRNPIALNSPARSQGHHREQSLSPTRTHFSLNTNEKTPPKHSPPPRSVSPAKSALKHRPGSPPPVPPVLVNTRLGNSPPSISECKARVSFSDEDSAASFTNGRPPISVDSTVPPELQVLKSTQRTAKGASQGVNPERTKNPLPSVLYSISPPPSSSSQEDLHLDHQGPAHGVTMPKVRLGHTPPETSPSSSVVGISVPELIVAAPTPREEGEEDEALLPTAQALGRFLAVTPAAAIQTREESDSDSDGASIYSDAHEELEESVLPNIMQVAQSEPSSHPSLALHTQPSANPPPPNSPEGIAQIPQSKSMLEPHKKESPPLPPDFTSSASSPRPRAPLQSSDSSSSPPSSPSSAASIKSVSSFKRIYPREPRTSMRSTMRSPSDQLRLASESRAQTPRKPALTKSSLRSTRIPDSDSDYRPQPFQSRFADSDDEDVSQIWGTGSGGGKAKLRRKRGDSDFTQKKSKVRPEKKMKGFWGIFSSTDKSAKLSRCKEKERPGAIDPPPVPIVPLTDGASISPVRTAPTTVGTGVIRKQKPWMGPESTTVKIEGPALNPKQTKKHGWKRLFGKG